MSGAGREGASDGRVGRAVWVLGFREEILGWVVRSLLCALPSFWYAVLADFMHPFEMAGIGIGVGCWVLALAAISASCRRQGWIRFDQALKRGAWIKTGVVALGVPLAMALHDFTDLPRAWSSVLAAIVLPDLPLGVFAVHVVGVLTGVRGELALAEADSGGVALAITLIGGALLIAVVLGVAVTLLGWQTVRRRVGRPRDFSPVRNPDQEVV